MLPGSVCPMCIKISICFGSGLANKCCKAKPDKKYMRINTNLFANENQITESQMPVDLYIKYDRHFFTQLVGWPVATATETPIKK